LKRNRILSQMRNLCLPTYHPPDEATIIGASQSRLVPELANETYREVMFWRRGDRDIDPDKDYMRCQHTTR